MFYLYGSFLSKITLSLLCIYVTVPYMSINPIRKQIVQVICLLSLHRSLRMIITTLYSYSCLESITNLFFSLIIQYDQKEMYNKSFL